MEYYPEFLSRHRKEMADDLFNSSCALGDLSKMLENGKFITCRTLIDSLKDTRDTLNKWIDIYDNETFLSMGADAKEYERFNEKRLDKTSGEYNE